VQGGAQQGGSTEQGSGAGVLARCANDEAYGRRGSSSGNGEQRSTARTRAGERARGGSEGAQVGEGEKRAQSTFIGRERERRRGERREWLVASRPLMAVVYTIE
jgi:hypothetical protein